MKKTHLFSMSLILFGAFFQANADETQSLIKEINTCFSTFSAPSSFDYKNGIIEKGSELILKDSDDDKNFLLKVTAPTDNSAFRIIILNGETFSIKKEKFETLAQGANCIISTSFTTKDKREFFYRENFVSFKNLNSLKKYVSISEKIAPKQLSFSKSGLNCLLTIDEDEGEKSGMILISQFLFDWRLPNTELSSPNPINFEYKPIKK